MTRCIKRVVVSMLIFSLLLGSIIFVQKNMEAKVKVSAESAILMDVQSGTILYSKNIDKKQYPASITKIMTALIAIENSTLSETVTYSRKAVNNLESGASNIGLVPGEKLTMEQSLHAILLWSANEACNGVAEHIAGSLEKFVEMMNEKAKSLGCTGTHFANANGLWQKDHYTTAHDMALIAREAYKNPTFAKITGTKRYNIGKTNKTKETRYLCNHHGMLYPYKTSKYLYDYCVGGKTGYTLKCKYTLVTYAKKGNMTLVSVVMRVPNGSSVEPNEYTDSTKLLNYGFSNFQRFQVQKEEAKVSNVGNLFTKFSPFFDQSTSSVSLDPEAGVILPKGVDFKQAKKTVEYYEIPKETDSGKKIIGKLSYIYDGLVVGGSNIYYFPSSSPTLKDSIDMTQWFDEAVEKANEEPFPWKIVLIFTGIAVVLIIAMIFVIYRYRLKKEDRARRNRYKKTRKSIKTQSSNNSFWTK